MMMMHSHSLNPTRLRSLVSYFPRCLATQAHMKTEDLITDEEVEHKTYISCESSKEAKPVLKFVEKHSKLRQIYERTYADGYYPKIKAVNEYDEKDVQ